MAELPGAVRARLGGLIAAHGCRRSTEQCLARLLTGLAADPHAPTPIRDPVQAVETHIADSLAGLEVDALRSAKRIADLGSGAGFPGLPLACAIPGATFSLVESVRRKADYLERTTRALKLPNVSVAAVRAEAWPEGANAHDAVLARALAPLAVIAEYASPLLREGGLAVAWKARPQRDEEHAGARAAEAVGLEPAATLTVTGPTAAESRRLYLYLKVRPTPERFPRRPGMAAKRPL